MNDTEKAINTLKKLKEGQHAKLDALPTKTRTRATDIIDIVNACGIAIESLEKQIPKKPTICACGKEMHDFSNSFKACLHCGKFTMEVDK